MSPLCRVARVHQALRPVAAIGAVSTGLFLGTALISAGAEPVPAPPASDEPVNVVPLFLPPKPTEDPSRTRPDTVRLLPPVAGNGGSDRVSRIDPEVDRAQESEGPAVPLLTPTPPAAAADAPPEQRPSNPIVQRAEMLQRDKEQRFDRLRGQLEDLIEKWEEQQKQLREQQAQMQAQKAAAPPTEMTPAQSPGSQKPLRTDEPGTQTTGPDADASNDSAASEATQTAEAPSQLPPQPGADSTQVEQRPSAVPLPPPAGNDPTGMSGIEGPFADSVVAEGPIDRLGLADSLFASGENALALELYRQLETSGDGLEAHDRYWVRYQIGCCYRRLNNIDEAQKWYRGVVADKEAGWVGELARWWLDHLEERFRMRGDAQTLQQTMQALEKQVNEQLNAAN
ncbi:hypothetical protein [Maioricimonas rarisocia]|uniref:hypothetical protein n=1 Tax=Maioricimonas rarisocia TaxID=2528026 RepID=UPI0011AA734D|nr:hypothetical protein [Maioricimonas rarisocia]